MFHVQPEDGHYQAPKHVVVPYVENTLYSTNRYNCVRPVHTLYIGYVDTVIWARVDGWRYQPKHVERFAYIKKLYIIATCWIIIDAYCAMR